MSYDTEIRRRVYQTRYEELKAREEVLKKQDLEASELLKAASDRYNRITKELGTVENDIRELKELAAIDGVELVEPEAP